MSEVDISTTALIAAKQEIDRLEARALRLYIEKNGTLWITEYIDPLKLQEVLGELNEVSMSNYTQAKARFTQLCNKMAGESIRRS